MCGPILGLVGGVMSGIAGAMGAQSQAAEYAQAAENHKAQAALERRQASIERTAGSYKAVKQQETVDRVLGSQRAAIGGSGISLSSGTAEDVISETAEEGAMDVAAIRWNSSLSGENQMYQSRISDMSAFGASQASKRAAKAAPLAFLTPVVGAVAKFGESAFGAMGG